MKTTRRLALVFCLTLVVQSCFAQAQDAAGCKDSPLFSRYPGSVLESCEHRDDDTYSFPNAKRERTEIEGDFTHLVYRFPKGVTTAPVLRNLVSALHSAGYIFEQNPTLDQSSFVVHKNGTWIHFEFLSNDYGSRASIVKEIAFDPGHGGYGG